MSIVNPVLTATLALFETQWLVHLSTVDLVIISFLFPAGPSVVSRKYLTGAADAIALMLHNLEPRSY
jgi:hypothetical protein